MRDCDLVKPPSNSELYREIAYVKDMQTEMLKRMDKFIEVTSRSVARIESNEARLTRAEDRVEKQSDQARAGLFTGIIALAGLMLTFLLNK